jgi:RND family efflux transporter MFP subunit
MAVLFVALVFLSACGKGGPEAKQAPKQQEAVLAKTDLRDVSTQIGTLEPKNKVLLKSEVSGTITKIFVKEGEVLRKGVPILLIDPRPYQNMREKLMINRKKTSLDLNILNRELQKDLVMSQEGAVSQTKLKDQQDKVELKQLELQALDIDLKDVNEKLEKAELTAPISGTLMSLAVKEGEIIVSATTGYSAGTDIGTLANTDAMEVLCDVSEVDYHSLAAGGPAQIYLESDPSARAKGTISFISKAAKVLQDRTVRTFEVRIDVTDLHPKMVAGINVSVEFVILDKKGVLALPAAFVQQELGDSGPTYHVLVKKGGKMEKRPVQVGATDYKFTEILSGLSEGETVVDRM